MGLGKGRYLSDSAWSLQTHGSQSLLGIKTSWGNVKWFLPELHLLMQAVWGWALGMSMFPFGSLRE